MGHGREGDGDRGGTSSGTTVYDAGMESTTVLLLIICEELIKSGPKTQKLGSTEIINR